jgi:hypothetical protein
MDCRTCSSFVTTETGAVLLDGVGAVSTIWHVEYPLQQGRFAIADRHAMLAGRRPSHYGAISLDMNGLDDFAGLWGLPVAGLLDVCCVVPAVEDHTDVLVERLAGRQSASGSCMAIFPPSSAPLTQRHLQWLWERHIAVAGPMIQPGQVGHGVGVFSGEYHWLTHDQDAVMVDIGPARVALAHPHALRHPECAISLSKQGCDLAMTLSDTLDDDDRLCFGIKCLEHMAVAMVAGNAASICLPPAGHARWDETVQLGPGCCERNLETAPLRVKRFQDRVDMGVLLRR